MDRGVINKWIDKVLEQDLHDKIYIPVETKADGRKLVVQFRKEVEILYKVDPIVAGTILVSYSFRDKRHWLVLERVIGNALVGFVRKRDGSTERVEISHDPDRKRRLSLMREDGFSLEQVEEMEGSLTEEEKEVFRG